MKKFLTGIFCSLFLFTFSDSFAQDQEAMAAWQEYMTPGKMHEMMASSEGDWTYTAKFWMAPGAEPNVSTGTMNTKMILGGRYMESHHHGSMMGMDFHGISITGYDNAKKVFINSWIDNFGTGMMTAEGNYNEDDKALHLKGTYFDPMTKTEKPFREVIHMVSNDKQLFEMYMMDGENEFKSMEIEFIRDQKASKE